MCGLNGFSFRDADLVGKMNRAIRHRGPDFAGTFLDEHVSLGHVLLSIRGDTDVSGQPFRDAGSPWVLLFNGQLYNTSQIKSRIDPAFKDEELDTRLLYELIKKSGWDFVRDIHGMFSIALYNADEGVIRLYRDPSGQKPLYYYCKDSVFLFSSEIKGILAYDRTDREMDPEAVDLTAAVGYIPGEKTLFRHIKKVNLSEEIAFDLRSQRLERRYFKSELGDYYHGDMGKTFETLIDEHLQSKRKVSINLSGGLDSSLILHEMCKKGFAVDSYTTSFESDDEYYNQDAVLARRLSKDYGTNHHEILIRKQDFLDAFTEAYRAIEEPNYNNSIPHLYLLFKREGIHGDGNRVVLSGDGGDELFAGYPHHLLSHRMRRKAAWMTPFLYNRYFKLRWKRDFQFQSVPEMWYFLRAFGSQYIKSRHMDPKAYVRGLADAYTALYKVKDSQIYETMLVDRVVWLGAENFIRSDKLAMSQSLELRSPLSYMPFREAVDRSIPEKKYHDKDWNKVFLREQYRGKLPGYIVDRKQKTGWRSPSKVWYDAKFKDLFLGILNDAEKTESIVDWAFLRKQVETAPKWPGKNINLYLSLGILKKEYGLPI